MKIYRTPLLACLFVLGAVVLTGCDCGPKANCPPPPPVAVVRPLPPPPPPAYTPPARGVCWVTPPGPVVVMPDPPTVTLNQAGQVVASTPTGRLQPPAADIAFVDRP